MNEPDAWPVTDWGTITVDRDGTWHLRSLDGGVTAGPGYIIV